MGITTPTNQTILTGVTESLLTSTDEGASTPTALVSSVQAVATTMSGTSATDTITAVDLNKTILMYRGFSSTDVIDDDNGANFGWKFDSTTQVSTNRQATDGTHTTRFDAVTFPDDVCKSVTHGTMTHSTGTQTTASAISGVDFDYSVAIWNGTSSANGAENPSVSLNTFKITDSGGEPVPTADIGLTTTGANVYYYSVIEFQPAAIVSINRMEIDIAHTSTTGTGSFSASVNRDNCVIFYNGIKVTSTTANAPPHRGVSIDFTDDDGLTATRTNTNQTVTVCATVVEFASGMINNRQAVTDTPTTGQTTNSTITAVDLDKTFIAYKGATLSNAAGDQNPAYNNNRIALTTTTNVAFFRNSYHTSECMPTTSVDIIESN